MRVKILSFLILPFFFFGFLYVFSATSTKKDIAFTKAIWIPYWRKDKGVEDTIKNIDTITEISPFAFELQNDGTLKNVLKIEEEPWLSLIKETRNKKIKIYPSILSYPKKDADKKAVYDLLSNKKKRQVHIKEITSLVKKNNFNGIDIDYENKLAEIKPYFSSFLTELSKELHKNKKQLICTIEPRTPPDSKYATTSKQILSKVEYANDYKVIGKVCDSVRIMAYDQDTDDAKLTNKERENGAIYAPIADIDWVKKVVTIAMWDIPSHKIIIGVPTYGYKYELIYSSTSNSIIYKKIGSMNYIYANELAKSLSITPTRGKTGELSFVYSTTTSSNGEYLLTPKKYLVSYSDAVSLEDKIKLAKLYKLGGVAIFKIDGGNDSMIFDVLRKTK